VVLLNECLFVCLFVVVVVVDVDFIMSLETSGYTFVCSTYGRVQRMFAKRTHRHITAKRTIIYLCIGHPEVAMVWFCCNCSGDRW